MSDGWIGWGFVGAGLLLTGGGALLVRRFKGATTHAGIGRGGHGPFAGLAGLLGGGMILVGACAALVGLMLALG